LGVFFTLVTRVELVAVATAMLCGCATGKVWLYHDKFVVAAESPHWEFKGEVRCERALDGNLADARKACDRDLREQAADLGATTVWSTSSELRIRPTTAKAWPTAGSSSGSGQRTFPRTPAARCGRLAVQTLVTAEPETDRPIFVGSPVDECGRLLESTLPELSLALKRDLRLAPANDPRQVDLRLVMSPGWEEPSSPLRTADMLTPVEKYPCAAATTRENGARIYFRASGTWGVHNRSRWPSSARTASGRSIPIPAALASLRTDPPVISP